MGGAGFAIVEGFGLACRRGRRKEAEREGRLETVVGCALIETVGAGIFSFSSEWISLVARSRASFDGGGKTRPFPDEKPIVVSGEGSSIDAAAEEVNC